MKLSKFIYKVDSICRVDISKQILVSERDYVSQFNTLIRYPLGIMSKHQYFIHAQTLNGSTEQKLGCDSIIIFELNDGYKVGLFEAKYPRYKKVNPNINYKAWDDGRFNVQLRKQIATKIKFPELIFWEYFIDNGPIGQLTSPFIDRKGSSIILLDKVKNYIPTTKSNWTLTDLEKALKKDGINIETLIDEILSCKHGKLLIPERNLLIIKSKVEDDKIVIPIIKSEDSYRVLSKFMKDNGLRNYIYLPKM
jgi:hypothetical protein